MFNVGCIVNYGDGIGTIIEVTDTKLTLAMHDGTTVSVPTLSCVLLCDRQHVIKMFEEGVLSCDKGKCSNRE